MKISNIEMISIDEEPFLSDDPGSPNSEPSDLHSYQELEKKNGSGTINEDITYHPTTYLNLAHSPFEGYEHSNLFAVRAERRTTSESEKDELYWDRRERNNESAKRCRVKRRLNDIALESRIMELTKENNVLRAKIEAAQLREQQATASSYENNKFSNDGGNSNRGPNITPFSDHNRSETYAVHYDPYLMHMSHQMNNNPNRFHTTMPRGCLEPRMIHSSSYPRGFMPNMTMVSLNSSERELSSMQQGQREFFDHMQRSTMQHRAQFSQVQMQASRVCPTTTVTDLYGCHQPPQVLSNKQNEILVASNRNTCNAAPIDTSSALPMPLSGRQATNSKNVINPSVSSSSAQSMIVNKSTTSPNISSKTPSTTSISSLPSSSPTSPKPAISNFNNLSLDPSAQNLDMNCISQGSSFIVSRQPSVENGAIKTSNLSYSTPPDKRHSNIKKRAAVESSVETSTHFMIDEILEHRETYPENPSKALDLSNVKKRKLFHPSVLHEEHGNVYNAIDKSQFHSFPRVSSINSTKNIDLLCAALL